MRGKYQQAIPPDRTGQPYDKWLRSRPLCDPDELARWHAEQENKPKTVIKKRGKKAA
jgi:hypothetical protein